MVPLRRLLLSLVVALAVLPLAVSPARAGDLPTPWEVHREVRSHVHGVLRELVRVPERIHSRHRAHLEIFLGGRSYYQPHRHYHESYRFPVWVNGAVAYRPFDYCGDRYFGAPGVRFELWRDWGRDHHAHWCGHCRSYWPTRHHHERYDRWDRYDRHDRYDRYDRNRRDGWDHRDRWDRYDRDDRREWDRNRDDRRRYDRDDDDRGRHRGRGHDGRDDRRGWQHDRGRRP